MNRYCILILYWPTQPSIILFPGIAISMVMATSPPLLPLIPTHTDSNTIQVFSPIDDSHGSKLIKHGQYRQIQFNPLPSWSTFWLSIWVRMKLNWTMMYSDRWTGLDLKNDDGCWVHGIPHSYGMGLCECGCGLCHSPIVLIPSLQPYPAHQSIEIPAPWTCFVEDRFGARQVPLGRTCTRGSTYSQ